MGEDTLGQVVGLDLVADREFFDARDEPEVAADDPLEQPRVTEPIEALLAHVALAAGEDQGQVAR